MTYQQYLKSEDWKRTRRWALDRAGNKCQLCNCKDKLEVHHNNYMNVGKEEPSDIIVLCGTCHKEHHKISREPVKLKVKYHPEVKRLIKRLEQNPSDTETRIILKEIDSLTKRKLKEQGTWNPKGVK